MAVFYFDYGGRYMNLPSMELKCIEVYTYPHTQMNAGLKHGEY